MTTSISRQALSLSLTLILSSSGFLAATRSVSASTPSIDFVEAEETVEVGEVPSGLKHGLRAAPEPAFDPSDYGPMPLPEVLSPMLQTLTMDRGNRVSFDLETEREVLHYLDEALSAGPSAVVEGGVALEGGIAAEGAGLGALRFSDYSLVPDPRRYPFSSVVKIFFTQPDGRYVCSGALISPMHVLTAGHCVHKGDGRSWSTDVIVIPAYASGSQPLGSARAVQLHTWTGWSDSRSFAHDLGLIDLDRPIGASAGWLGYGYDTRCGFFTSGPVHHRAGYPAANPFDGQHMWYRSGQFDRCPTATNAEAYNQEWGGASGSPSWFDTTNPIALAALSYGATNGSYFGVARLDPSKFEHVKAAIAEDRPAAPDLAVVDVQAENRVSPGGAIRGFRYAMLNAGAASFSGNVRAEVYLSADPQITPGDALLQTHQATVSLSPNGRTIVSVPAARIPSGTPTGLWYLGVRIVFDDANPANNVTGPGDVARLEVVIEAPDAPPTERGVDLSGTSRLKVQRLPLSRDSLRASLAMGNGRWVLTTDSGGRFSGPYVDRRGNGRVLQLELDAAGRAALESHLEGEIAALSGGPASVQLAVWNASVRINARGRAVLRIRSRISASGSFGSRRGTLTLAGKGWM